MVEIRKIRPDETFFLREMLYEAIYFADESKRLPRSIVFEPPISKYIDDFGRRGDFAYVLVDQTELVGAVWARLFAESEKSYGFVDGETPELSIAILETYRNRGFGRIMIETLLSALRVHGYEKVSLSVDRRNRAVGLYRKLGFETVSERGTAFTMFKNLSK